MTTSPFLTTERFELWRPAADDLDGLVRLLEGRDMTRFLGPARADPFSQFERLSRNAGSWALFGYGTLYVRPRGQSDLIGIHPWRGFGKGMDDVAEAGWIVRRDRWGQGVAGEVMRTVLPWFDEVHGQQRITCMIEEGNGASERLAAALGFIWYDRQAEGGDDRAVINLYERAR